MRRLFIASSVVAAASVVLLTASTLSADTPGRQPSNDQELNYWLQNMVWYHHFNTDEISLATGLTLEQIASALAKFELKPTGRPPRTADAPLLVLPYPGGRHPRLGFFEGAVNPQRETKISVFCPWDERSYVVVDVPEAVWSNLGLLYLAHSHVPTLWTKAGIELPRQEWERRVDGAFQLTRRLPNGIEYVASVSPAADHVAFELRLTNGTSERLTDLRVQNCVMLGRASGFSQQTTDNKLFSGPYAACRSDDGTKWVITAWEPLHRTWANPRCPCLHSDPKFADCEPGQTVRVYGRLWFYQGREIDAELHRLELSGWRQVGEAGRK